MKGLFGALSLPQILTFIFGTALVFVVKALLPEGELQTAILNVLPQILAILLVLTRKPSDSGGTTQKSK